MHQVAESGIAGAKEMAGVACRIFSRHRFYWRHEHGLQWRTRCRFPIVAVQPALPNRIWRGPWRLDDMHGNAEPRISTVFRTTALIVYDSFEPLMSQAGHRTMLAELSNRTLCHAVAVLAQSGLLFFLLVFLLVLSE